MRDIRFRAWDKETKVFVPQGMIRMDASGQQHWLLTGLDWLMPSKDKALDIQFYTGLKDKNGKECYWDDWVTDGINPKFLVTPDYHLLARLSEIEFEIVGNKYEVDLHS